MKTVEEIAKTPNLLIEANNEAGGYGRLRIWRWLDSVQ